MAHTVISSDFTTFNRGLDMAVELLESAYGVKGGNVVLCGTQDRRVFDDGFKALEIFSPKDPVEREAVLQLYGAANATRSLCGDGTSTTALLAAEFVRCGRSMRSKGSAKRVTERLKAAVDYVVSHVNASKAPATERDVVNAVKLAMHGDAASAEQIGRFRHAYGPDSVMFAQATFGAGEVKVVEDRGLVWMRGAASQALLRGEQRVKMGPTLVVMSADPCGDLQSPEWRRILEAFAQVAGPNTGLLLVCPEASGNLLATFSMQAGSGKSRSVSLVPDGLKSWEFLSSLAAVIGGRVISSVNGNIGDRFDQSWFGAVPSVEVGSVSTVLGVDDVILQRMGSERVRLSGMLEGAENDRERNSIKERLAFYSGVFGRIDIPYVSESQFAALKETVEDGVLAGKAALSGVVPGCGKALLEASRCLRSDLGEDVLSDCFASLYHRLSSPSGEVVFEGYWDTVDMSGDGGVVVDARESGIVDSAEVVMTAVKVAASVAAPLIEANMLVVYCE